MPDLLHEIELLAREQERLQERLASAILELQLAIGKTPSQAEASHLDHPIQGSRQAPNLADVHESLRELQLTIRWLQERARSLDERCTAVTELSAVNCARIEEILHSRTWRALTQTGGFVLRLFGR